MNAEKLLYHNGPSEIISERNTPRPITPPKSFSVATVCSIHQKTKKLLRHLGSQHRMNESHRCPACPTIFGSLTTLNEHEETNHMHEPLPTSQSASVEFTTQAFNSRFQIHRMKMEDSVFIDPFNCLVSIKNELLAFIIS